MNQIMQESFVIYRTLYSHAMLSFLVSCWCQLKLRNLLALYDACEAEKQLFQLQDVGRNMHMKMNWYEKFQRSELQPNSGDIQGEHDGPGTPQNTDP